VEWELLRDVPLDDVERLLSIARRRTFKPAEVVFHQDDLGDSLHLVVKGRFAITRRTARGEDALLAIRTRGPAFGELALISGRGRSATVWALEAGETLSVHRIDFEALRTRHPSVDRTLVALLAAQIERMDQLLSEAFYESANRRVLRRLLELGNAGERGDEVEVRITQDQLAALSGASRSTVSAVLAAEQRHGTIVIRRGATILRDRAALARRAGLRVTDD
jgi:CRP/FNR family transcriptional regulator, cyclic AMP receptor protein